MGASHWLSSGQVDAGNDGRALSNEEEDGAK